MASSLNGTGITFSNGQTQSMAAIGGDGQTWQNVAGSRTYGVTYTNDTGRPIFLGISMNQAGANRNPNFSLVVNGITVGASSATSYAFNYQMTAIVPAGGTYLMNRTSGSVYAWAELR